MAMTETLLRKICREQDLYTTPSLNETLYCNFQGFTSIGGLEGYTSLRSLFLEGNALVNLSGLRACDLTCLYLQNNCLTSLVGLENAPNLRILDISHNKLLDLAGIANCPRLSTLHCVGNLFEGIEAISDLSECEELSTLDLRSNGIMSPEVVGLLQGMQHLCSLYIKDNPFVEQVRSCRKVLISSLPKLVYLDDRPVFEMERAAAAAWLSGGPEAERDARRQLQAQTAAKEKANFDALLLIRKESFRKRRQDLGLPPGDTDPFYDNLKEEDWKELEDPPELQTATQMLSDANLTCGTLVEEEDACNTPDAQNLADLGQPFKADEHDSPKEKENNKQLNDSMSSQLNTAHNEQQHQALPTVLREMEPTELQNEIEDVNVDQVKSADDNVACEATVDIMPSDDDELEDTLETEEHLDLAVVGHGIQLSGCCKFDELTTKP